jgi:predicted DNA-binding transcriptional regulator AlpA
MLQTPAEQTSPYGTGDMDGRVLVTSREVYRRYPIDKATLWRWINQGQFPKPDLVINRKRFWRLSTIDAFERGKAG